MKNINVIKFDGEYEKLRRQTGGELIDVRVVTVNKASSDELIDYDTCRLDGTFYNLKFGEYLQLTFMGNLGIPLSTFRKINTENLEKYCGNEGTYFDFEVEDE